MVRKGKHIASQNPATKNSKQTTVHLQNDVTRATIWATLPDFAPRIDFAIIAGKLATPNENVTRRSTKHASDVAKKVT